MPAFATAIRPGRLPWILTLLFAACAGMVAQAWAMEAGEDTWAAQANATLSQLDGTLDAWQTDSPDQKDVLAVFEEVTGIRDRAERCVADSSQRLAGVSERLATLGTATTGEAPDIRATRSRLEDEQQGIERQLAVCRLLAINARDARETAGKLRREALSRELLNRGEPLWQVAARVMGDGFGAPGARPIAFKPWPSVAIGLALLALLLPIAAFLARALREHFSIPGGDEAAPMQRRSLLAGMYARRLPWLAGLAAIFVTLFIAGATPVAAVGAALLLSTLVAPLLHLFVCRGRLVCADGMRARLLLDLVLVAGALRLVEFEQYLPGDAFVLLRALFHLLLAIVALSLLRGIVRRDDLDSLRSLRLPIALLLLAGPVVDWLGYRNLGSFLTVGVYGSGAGIMLVSLLLSSVSQLAAQLGDVDAEQQPELRRWLGYTQGENVPGLSPLVWLVRIGALIGLAYWLLTTWQVSATGTTAVREFLRSGFEIGSVRIVPTKLLLAVFAFLLLLALARWLRRQLGERWLTRTSLDSGARQSIVSLTSYTIIGVAIMLALSMAGLNFQNLAIVAGALSVGIGFGLQNIVNNFVSGLILLFERPVRPGDWVIVGNTEGYVRRISIRYTLIQTFDRAEVLVPNSELISNQVTNLMLTDTFGRVRIPVGVAYGTDTRQVRDILQRVARNHPMTVLHDPRVSPPLVFFMGFGDSSLNFELRLFIQNIDYKLSVSSDIHFAIDDAFREAGIEIPFPQRVVHMAETTNPMQTPHPEGDTR